MLFVLTVDRGKKHYPASSLVEPRTSRESGEEYVQISRKEYEHLIVVSQQYASLCDNLIRGGVDSDTLLLLSTAQPHTAGQERALVSSKPSPTHHQADFTSDVSPFHQSFPSNGHSSFSAHSAKSQVNRPSTWQHYDEDEDNEEDLNESQVEDHRRAHEEKPEQRTPSRNGNRTVLISNLSESVTLADVSNVVKGGPIIDMFMRYRDRSVAVSFLYHEDCKAFYNHVRRNDLYINQKRVNVSWNERQFIVSEHIARKVALGATRNLVVKRCSAIHTEESIRQDLDHIHNLVPIKIEFLGGDCSIQTNSVVGATFARTCMMSRQKYKASRIEFGVDDCAQSLDRMPTTKRRNFAEPVASNDSFATLMANRFQLLQFDEN